MDGWMSLHKFSSACNNCQTQYAPYRVTLSRTICIFHQRPYCWSSLTLGLDPQIHTVCCRPLKHCLRILAVVELQDTEKDGADKMHASLALNSHIERVLGKKASIMVEARHQKGTVCMYLLLVCCSHYIKNIIMIVRRKGSLRTWIYFQLCDSALGNIIL